MTVQNISEQELILDVSEVGDKKTEKRVRHTIGPKQVVTDVPAALLKHPQWAALTGANGPLRVL